MVLRVWIRTSQPLKLNYLHRQRQFMTKPTKVSKVTLKTQQTSILYASSLMFIKNHYIYLKLDNNLLSKYLKASRSIQLNKPSKTVINQSKCRSQRFRSQSGFNLIELIVTVLILAIIATIAAPAILTQLASMEAKRVRKQLESTLKIAKAESFIRRQNLLVCLSDAGGRCNKNSNKNLLLFVDKNNNKDFDVSTDYLLSKLSLSPKYGTLHLRAGKRHYVRFYGDTGKPRGHFGHIKYCPSSTYSQAMYQISFNQGGIIKYKPNGIHPTDCS